MQVFGRFEERQIGQKLEKFAKFARFVEHVRVAQEILAFPFVFVERVLDLVEYHLQSLFLVVLEHDGLSSGNNRNDLGNVLEELGVSIFAERDAHEGVSDKSRFFDGVDFDHAAFVEYGVDDALGYFGSLGAFQALNELAEMVAAVVLRGRPVAALCFYEALFVAQALAALFDYVAYGASYLSHGFIDHEFCVAVVAIIGR